MQKYKQLLITVLIVLSFIFTAFSVVADVTDGNVTINTPTNLTVYGNNNGIIPARGDSQSVYTNTLTVNSSVTNNAFGGLSYGSGSVNNNTVTINNSGSVNGEVYGGHGSAGVFLNNVEIFGTVTGVVYGGNSTSNYAVADNTVTIKNNGQANNFIFGGYSGANGNVTDNTVIIETNGIGGSNTSQAIYGGYSNGSGNITGNTVVIDGTAKSIVYGGFSNDSATKTGIVSNNKIEIRGTASNVFGGTGYSTVSFNTITISGTVIALVRAGYSVGTGDATNNTVIIESGGSGGTVYGGYTSTAAGGKVTYNKVEISGTAGNVYGGYATHSDNTGTVENNAVVININAITSNVYGGRTNGLSKVVGNTTSINGEANYVYGGVISNASSDATVSGNTVNISGKANNTAYGGYTTGTGNVTGNTVAIENGSTAAGNVYGGYVGNTSSAANVSGNMVEISGTVNNAVYCGYTRGTGAVINNTLNIASTAILTTSTSLWGSNISGVVSNGNTLKVDGFNGSIDTMGNFEYYDFVLGKLDSNNSFITITGAPVDIDYTIISISFSSAFKNNPLSVGDTITVISSITNSDPSSCSIKIDTQSPFVTYTFAEVHNTALELIVIGMNPKNETSFVGEGFAAGLAFLGQAADIRSSIYFVPQGPRFIPFAKMVYGKQYISTGSSVNVKGFSAIAGLALNTNFDNGSQLVVGAFVEGGWGDYNSRHSFNNSSTIKGKGDTEYYGGGVLARYALKTGLYNEGSFAAGKAETDFRTYDFTPGTRSKYDYSVPYYSTHITVGQVLSLTDMLNLDVYGKYLWARQGGDNVTVDGYRFKFKDADSHRLRAGAKLQADASLPLQSYVGGAYEYEFSGRIKGSLYGMNLDKPSLRGGTGIGELGLVWTPNDAENLRVDLGVQGYVGKREGVSGGLTVTMSF